MVNGITDQPRESIPTHVNNENMKATRLSIRNPGNDDTDIFMTAVLFHNHNQPPPASKPRETIKLITLEKL